MTADEYPSYPCPHDTEGQHHIGCGCDFYDDDLGVLAFEHPAKWSAPVLDVLADMVEAEHQLLERKVNVLDPFAGRGRGELAEALAAYGVEHRVWGVELQSEWAGTDALTLVGDATRLKAEWTGLFDVVATSPCLEQGHLVLTDDLRWVPVGDLEVGDHLLAFDEHRTGSRGIGARRRWKRTEVIRSVPRSVECVRVVLANGDELVTTPEHPWLTYQYSYGARAAEWCPSRWLEGKWVQLQVRPWTTRRDYDAGWLAGMFDGEGSLSLGTHGSPKLSLCQVDGPVLDRAEALMDRFGYAPNRIWRTGVPVHRQKIGNLYVTGGFPGMLRALGELRPTRLLDKWANMDVSSRTVQAERVQVVRVEPGGVRDIQEVETTAGTYIGEGYLHHNCYGNRMADRHQAKDPCKTCGGSGCALGVDRCSGGHPDDGQDHQVCKACKGSGLSMRHNYAHYLRRQGGDLAPGSAAGLQWGPQYRLLHKDAITEMVRVLVPDGLLLVNMKNHPRDGDEQLVCEWWTNELLVRGCRLVEVRRVDTPGLRHGANHDKRVDGELVIAVRTPPASEQGRLV